MKMERKHIQKDLTERLKELEVSLQSIELSLNQIKGHESADVGVHVHNLLPQLRQLIAIGGRNFHPRLFDIADEFKIPLEFYAVSATRQELGVTMEAKIPGSEQLFRSPTRYFPIHLLERLWSPFPMESPEKVSLGDWMQEMPFQDENIEYSRNDLLRAVTDKDGGGHLDNNQDLLVSSLYRNFFFTGTQGVEWSLTGRDLFLIDLATLVLWLGKRVLLYADLGTLDHPEVSQTDLEFANFKVIDTRGKYRLALVMPRLEQTE